MDATTNNEILMASDDSSLEGGVESTKANAGGKARAKRTSLVSMACEKCRKGHRKCYHRVELGAAGLNSQNLLEVPKKSKTERRKSLSELAGSSKRTRPRRESFAGTTGPTTARVHNRQCRLSDAQLQYFIDHVSVFCVGNPATDASIDFWTVSVPRMTQMYPLLQDGIFALCNLFQDCPRPADLRPVDVLGQISKAFQGLQHQLRRFEGLRPNEKVVAFVVSCLLAVVTFYGLGSTRDLKAHFTGLHAIVMAGWQDMVDAASPLRDCILTSRNYLVMAEQLPITPANLALLEPLLLCIPSEDFTRTEVDHGSLMHLLIISNKAMHARVSEADKVVISPSPAQTASVFVDFVEYRIHADDVSNLEELVPDTQVTRAYALSIKSLFGLAAFVSLKHSQGVHEHNFRNNLRSYLSLLRKLINESKALKPVVSLKWPELILGDLEQWDLVESTSWLFSDVEPLFASRYPCRPPAPEKLMPWTQLDEVLSNSLFVLEM